MTLLPPIDPLELYASGIDTSDYVARVAPLIRQAAGPIGDLLDIGAGGGQLGRAIREAGRAWTAIEPGPVMQRRLAALGPAPQVLACGWREADPAPSDHDTVLAANMPAPLTDAAEFLALCRRWARRQIVWVVPAQDGPRGLCLAGCLPREWHGEDDTPGVDIVLRQLPPEDHPDRRAQADWSFRLDVPSVPEIAHYLAGRLGWPAEDDRREALRAHLAAAAEPVAGGFRLTVPRSSAILVWGAS